MADSRITDLTAGGVAQPADQFVVARSGTDYKIAGSAIPGAQLDYVERTTNLSVSATTAGGADHVIDGGAVTYDGSTKIRVEFFTPLAQCNSGQALIIELYDGSTGLGAIAQLGDTGQGYMAVPLYGARVLTPSAASHSYSIRAWKTGGTAQVEPQAGGAAGTRVPAYLRITVVG